MFSKSFKQDAVLLPQSGVIDASGATSALNLPSGTTAQRPLNPPLGATRFNTTIAAVEMYVAASTWQTVTSSLTTYSVSFLIVGAGGGGGGSIPTTTQGGGGGGGGYLTGSALVTVGTSYAITVGAAGAAGGVNANGSNGNSSVAFGTTASGGGGGGSWGGIGTGVNGASGGGGGTCQPGAAAGGAGLRERACTCVRRCARVCAHVCTCVWRACTCAFA